MGLFLISILLFGINISYNISGSDFSKLIKVFTLLTLIISLCSIIVFNFNKTLKVYRIVLVVVSIFLILNLSLVKDVIAYEYESYRLSEVYEMDSCEKAEIQFAKDLKNGELKFFIFGIGTNPEVHRKLKEDYNLEVFYMGCIILSSYECYNKLVVNKLNLKIR